MGKENILFEDVVAFHGHVCPGLAMGYRVALAGLEKLKVNRAVDEDLVAVVENNSCAVDAIQVVAGCTFGKGNLQLKDYGKQVYSFYKRQSGDSVRVIVSWAGISESDSEKEAWQKYFDGDRSTSVMATVQAVKKRKVEAILRAADDELFEFQAASLPEPDRATVYPTVECSSCGEKMMQPKSVSKGGKTFCMPCSEKK